MASSSSDIAALGRAMLRDLFGDEQEGDQKHKQESLAEELEREFELLPDGAAALGQWRRAREAAAAAASGAAAASSSSSSPLILLLPPARLLQELAHDRLHTGRWSDAPRAWRAAHAAGTLAAVGARLAMEGEQRPPPSFWPPALAEFLLEGEGDQPRGDRQVLLAALRALDVAIILGAPAAATNRLRAALDAAAERADAALAAALDDGGDETGSSTKRRRLEAPQQAPPPPAPRLPPRSLSAASTSRLAASSSPPPLDAFFAQHMRPRLPLLIARGLMEGWPAASRWRDFEYLQRTAGKRTVPVEAGEHFLDPALATALLPFGEFLRRAVGESGGSSSDPPSQRLYLAQHPLLDQLPRLRRDVLVPDYCALADGESGRSDDKSSGSGSGSDGDDETAAVPSSVAINAWVSGPGAVTPLHHDGERHNLLCVVAGRKYVRLYPPGARTEAALEPLPPPHTNASALAPADFLSPASAATDALAPLDEDVMIDAMVGPGQALYIPPGWWHYVSSWAEDEKEEDEGDGGARGAAAPTMRALPPPPRPPPRYCFAVSFWW